MSTKKVKRIHAPAPVHRFDNYVSNSFKALPKWLKPIMVACSFLGEPIVIIAVSIYIVLVTYKTDHESLSKAFLAAIIACGIIGLMKLIIHRRRPATPYVSLKKFRTYSFPSGHTFSSTVIYGLIAYLALTTLNFPWSYSAALSLWLLIILVGLSRIYLGAHYASDVIGGWLLGGLTLLLIVEYLLLI